MLAELPGTRPRPLPGRDAAPLHAIILIALTTAALMACSPFTAINALAPVERYAAERNLAYGDQSRRRLSVFAPPEANDAPVVVFGTSNAWVETPNAFTISRCC